MFRLAERVLEDAGDGVSETGHDIFPIEHVVGAESDGRPVGVAGAPHVDLSPPRPHDPHETRSAAKVVPRLGGYVAGRLRPRRHLDSVEAVQ